MLAALPDRQLTWMARACRIGSRIGALPVPVLLVLLILSALPVSVLLVDPVRGALGLPSVAGTAAVDVLEALAPLLAALLCARRAGLKYQALRAQRDRAGGGSSSGASSSAGSAVLHPRHATGWALLAAACASWGVGQVLWTVYEVILSRPSPPLSWADPFFLGFAVLAPAGMVLLGRGTVRAASRLAAALDGVMVAIAFATVSWLLVLQPMLAGAGDDVWVLAVQLAYPAGDLVVLTVATMLVARVGAHGPVMVLASGAVVMAVADSAYLWSGLSGGFFTGGVVDVLWTTAFVVMGLSATVPYQPRLVAQEDAVAPWAQQVLPYLPFAVAMVAVVAQGARQALSGSTLALMAMLCAFVLARQGIVIAANSRLTRQLQVMAYTDTLTGVSNRASFLRALRQALSSAAQGRVSAWVAYCDLDHFKAVNDLLGHEVGDALLVAVAGGLRDAVRNQDVVARLGGDEFAVLVTDRVGGPAGGAAAPGGRGRGSAGHAEDLRERLSGAVQEAAAGVAAGLAFDDPRLIEAALVVQRVTCSVGVVCSQDFSTPTVETLLKGADERMYMIKRAAYQGGVRVSPVG